MKLVKVTWSDIVADLHTEDNIKPCESYSVGWVETHNKKFIRLYTSYYKDGIKLADKIVIPIGCIISIENLKVDKGFVAKYYIK